MKGPEILLRSASGIAFLQGLAHSFAIATYAPHHGPAELAIVSAMRAQFFNFGGPWAHSYWEMYSGYAWLAAINCFVQAAVLWMIASWSRKVSILPLVGMFLAANFVHAAIVLRFFFLTPLVPDLIVASLLIVACAQLRMARVPELTDC